MQTKPNTSGRKTDHEGRAGLYSFFANRCVQIDLAKCFAISLWLTVYRDDSPHRREGIVEQSVHMGTSSKVVAVYVIVNVN